MNAEDTIPQPSVIARRRVRRYRLAGGLCVLLGLIGAGVVYWLGSRAADLSDDPAMVGFNRAEQRQLGILYGSQGALIEDLTNSLKQPGTQALIILAAAGAIAAGCFYFARILAEEAKAAAVADQPHG
jgi:hypothetical protein